MLADIVDRVLREELVGERADHREWIWHRLWELDRTEEFPIWLLGVVDVALWDLEGRVLGRPGSSAAWHVPRRDPRVRVDVDVHVRPRSTSTSPTSASSLATRRSSSMPGVMLVRTPSSASACGLTSATTVDLMYDGSAGVRPPRRRVSRSCAGRGRLPLVRGADARVQRHGLQVAGRACRRAAARRRDLRRRSPQHGRLHRVRLRDAMSARAPTTAAG